MKESCIIAVWLCCLAGSVWGQAEDGQPFFEKARKKHYDPRSAGLTGFKVSLVLKKCTEPQMKDLAEEVRVDYSWVEPDKESFAARDVDEKFREPLGRLCKGMWKDLTGTFAFDLLEGAKKLQYSIKRGDPWLIGFNGPNDMVVTVFDPTTLALESFERVIDKQQGGDVDRYGFQEKDGLLRIAWREVRVVRTRIKKFKAVYGDFENHDSFQLPTTATFTDAGGSTFSFELAYDEVERRSEKVTDFTEREVRDAVHLFKKSWKKWSPQEKVLQIRKLARYAHDKVSAALSKQGLKDKDHGVRMEALKQLGELGRKNVVGDLMRLYKATEAYEKTGDEEKKKRDRSLHLGAIAALGKIGDPRPIPLFAEGWGNLPEPKEGESTNDLDYGPAKAKVTALGRIRHRDSVDTVLKIWGVGGLHVGVLVREITGSLRQLTGQDFDKDIYAWKNWWNKNKGSFRFR
ncbi:MAG: HEAT repeat domain-containing protein [Planctomycetota bacterium]|jgi:hypothetical protein